MRRVDECAVSELSRDLRMKSNIIHAQVDCLSKEAMNVMLFKDLLLH